MAPPPPPPQYSSSSSRKIPHCSTRSILSSIAIFLSGVSFALTLSAAFNVSSRLHNNNNHNDDSPVVVVATAACRCEGGGGSTSSNGIKSTDEDEEKDGTNNNYYDARAIISSDEKIIKMPTTTNTLTNTTTTTTTTTFSRRSSSNTRSMTSILRDRLLQSFRSSSSSSHDSARTFNNYSQHDTHDMTYADFDDDDGICSILSQPTPSILSLWSLHLRHVFNASRHPADPTFIFHDFTSQLLKLMTPDRLQRSVKTLPLDWTPVGRALDVVHRRLTSIHDEIRSYQKMQRDVQNDDDRIPIDELRRIDDSPSHPRKLNVLVMGGSVTMGVVCHINPVTAATGKYSRRDCAWPGRLASFFANLFGGIDLIDVHTVALGGTNTESGITIWDYSLLPEDVPFPDVVINAYSTNDMHYNSVQEAMRRNITLGESLLAMGQEFIRVVLTPKSGCAPRAPPLLLYVDDYLGNEQNEIFTTMMSPQTINLLSGYYGVGSMSFGDAVRDIVYGDTKEWWFSADWYEKGKSRYQRAVHPHMGMHISMVWVVAFNLLNLVTTYCSLPKIVQSERRLRHHDRYHAGVESSSEGVWDYGYSNSTFGGDLPALQGTNELAGGPRRKPRGLPPLLTSELSLEHITELWRNESDAASHLWKTYDECLDLGTITNNDEYYDKPCLYSWVANLERKLDNTQRITDRLKPFITSNEGWSAVDDNNKLGWAPTSGIGSTFTLEWKNISQPVRAVTWMIMRSYGEKWDGSLLDVEVWSGNTLVSKNNIEGFHNKTTSETYNIKMNLFDNDKRQGDGNGVVNGSDLKIVFTLVGGSTFKISGMAICDH